MRRLRLLLNTVVLALIVGTGIPAQAQQSPYFPTAEGWRASSPEAQGFDSVRLAKFLDYMTSGPPDAFHSILVIRHGYVVLDASLSPFGSAQPQAFRESCEPVIATLIGIAIDQGLIRSVDQSIWDFLPKDKTANMDVHKSALTIKDFLIHRSGLNFSEARDFETYYPFGAADPAWLQFFLDAGTVPLGTNNPWFYGDGLVLSAILQQATGMTALDFARQNLFGPLGINDVTWLADPQGVTIGLDELYMSPQNMARIAYLYLHNGQWQSQQIVSERWVQAATGKIINFSADFPVAEGFGYGWYVTGDGPERTWLQYAESGEYFGVSPDLDLIYMVTGDSAYKLLGMAEMFLSPSNKSAALPENSEALAPLNDRIEALAHPTPHLITPLPDALKAASGTTFRLDDNPLGWQTLAVDFGAPGSKEATLTLGIDGQNIPLTTGLDFVDRITPVGLPAQSASAAYRLLGGLPWKAKADWTDQQLHVWMGDLMGRESWSVTLGLSEAKRVTVDVVLQGLKDTPDLWSFKGVSE